MKNQSNYKLFLLVGPSGSGKNTVMEGVTKNLPQIKRLPSFTTRPKREVEKEGREHFFISVEKFKQLIRNGEFLEYEEVYPDMYYGMSLGKTQKSLLKNHIIKDIDILGARNIKKMLPKNTVLIFIKPPRLEELKERIRRRGNITKKEVESRLKRISMEMQKAHLADYQVVNDKLPKCIKDVIKIVKKELTKTL